MTTTTMDRPRTRTTDRAAETFRPLSPPPADLRGEPRAAPMAAAFRTLVAAENALERLFRAGFHVDQMSLVTPKPERVALGTVTAMEAPQVAAKRWASAGGLLGAIVGAVIALGFVSTAGLGALAAAAPMIVGLLGGAVVGSLVAAMIRRGLAPESARRYLRARCEGGTLLLVDVHGDEQARQAEIAFAEAGAVKRA